ncbi:hypothetical protein SNE40_008936 [Patella caerulea]|uniref:Cadherin-like beta-sandwich-like domain-containing protein n=1 Tax=Patella caerulea TaxID=87958 RepID=A0AAN8JQ58_PATCE
MDDCDLDKLCVKPGKLNRAFDKSVTEYSITLTSDIEKLTLDPLTSDGGASYRIFGSDESKSVALPEGCVTDIKIEVTAEDGRTTKYYFIHAKRLSSKAAELNDIQLNRGTLSPEFTSSVFEYNVLVACDVAQLSIKPTVPDIKMAVVINGEKSPSDVCLNIGQTIIQIEVTSVDGSNKQLYTIEVVRKQIPRFVKFTDSQQGLLFECPISLNPLYQPITIKNSEPTHTFSGPLISEYTKTSKYDPLNNQPLPPDWKIVSQDLDSKMSSAMVSIPLINGKMSEEKKFTEIGSILLEKCNIVPKVEDVKDRFKDTTVTSKHTIQTRKWEKNLQQIYDETDVKVLENNAREHIEKYFDILPTPGVYRHFDEGESPLDYLEIAVHNYATAVKFKPKDANLHSQLAMLLEEMYYVEDMSGLKKETAEDIPSMNNEAKEGAKLEEALAICKLRGVESSAPVSLQLKAIDEEYHHLLDSGQSGRADQVMGLYAWFSKKISQEAVAAHKVNNEESPLGQAYQKYLDALSLEETKSIHNFHVGRLLVMQGEFEEAIKRLEITINWNPQHQMARFYLGFALSLKRGGPGDRCKETIGYLLEAMETLLTENTKIAVTDPLPCKRRELLVVNLLRSNNIVLLRGIIQLGKLLTKNPSKDCISAEHVFYTASLLASQVLPTLSRGDLYKQVEWVLLDSHANLLEIYANSSSPVEALIAQRCERLSALIYNCTIPQNGQLQELQEKTCQKLVTIHPSDSHALYLLGTAQMARYENSSTGQASEQLLTDAKSSFEASIMLEGQPVSGVVPDLLKKQEWWQVKVKEEERKAAEEAKKAEIKSVGGKAGVSRGGGVNTRGRGGTTTPATRGGTTARGGAARGGTTTSRGARGGAANKSIPVVKSTSSTTKATGSKGHVCEVTKTNAKAPDTKPTTEIRSDNIPSQPVSIDSSAPKNKKSYLPRLGLARALKLSGDTESAKKCYDQVISMSPEVHDAYIENAEMLTKSDPLEAVNVFCKFPVPDEPSFDDAYIFGEIVRLLMKNEKYDDPRLASNLVSYGRVLGLGALEKNVKILEEKFKFETLKTVYAGVNRKSVDDPDLQAFFKFKLWI